MRTSGSAAQAGRVGLDAQLVAPSDGAAHGRAVLEVLAGLGDAVDGGEELAGVVVGDVGGAVAETLAVVAEGEESE